MNETLIGVGIFLAGTVLGAILVITGIVLGFRVSCAIRQSNNGEEPTLNKSEGLPAEIALLEKEE